MENFGTRLRDAMEQKDISASELSRRSGVGKNLISYYIHGRCLAKQDKVFALAKALDVNPAWLMTGVEQTTEEEFWQDSQEQPKTEEAKILSRGIDRLPKEQREQALAMFKLMFAPQFADLFTKEEEDDDT